MLAQNGGSWYDTGATSLTFNVSMASGAGASSGGLYAGGGVPGSPLLPYGEGGLALPGLGAEPTLDIGLAGPVKLPPAL